MRRSGRRLVGELDDGGRDPAPGLGTIVIALGRELVNARGAFLEGLARAAGCSANARPSYSRYAQRSARNFFMGLGDGRTGCGKIDPPLPAETIPAARLAMPA